MDFSHCNESSFWNDLFEPLPPGISLDSDLLNMDFHGSDTVGSSHSWAAFPPKWGCESQNSIRNFFEDSHRKNPSTRSLDMPHSSSLSDLSRASSGTQLQVFEPYHRIPCHSDFALDVKQSEESRSDIFEAYTTLPPQAEAISSESRFFPPSKVPQEPPRQRHQVIYIDGLRVVQILGAEEPPMSLTTEYSMLDIESRVHQEGVMYLKINPEPFPTLISHALHKCHPNCFVQTVLPKALKKSNGEEKVRCHDETVLNVYPPLKYFMVRREVTIDHPMTIGEFTYFPNEKCREDDFYAPKILRKSCRRKGNDGLCPFCPFANYQSLNGSNYVHHLETDHGIYKSGLRVREPLNLGKHPFQKTKRSRITTSRNTAQCPECHQLREISSWAGNSNNPYLSYLRHYFDFHVRNKKDTLD